MSNISFDFGDPDGVGALGLGRPLKVMPKIAVRGGFPIYVAFGIPPQMPKDEVGTITKGLAVSANVSRAVG